MDQLVTSRKDSSIKTGTRLLYLPYIFIIKKKIIKKKSGPDFFSTGSAWREVGGGRWEVGGGTGSGKWIYKSPSKRHKSKKLQFSYVYKNKQNFFVIIRKSYRTVEHIYMSRINYFTIDQDQLINIFFIS